MDLKAGDSEVDIYNDLKLLNIITNDDLNHIEIDQLRLLRFGLIMVTGKDGKIVLQRNEIFDSDFSFLIENCEDIVETQRGNIKPRNLKPNKTQTAPDAISTSATITNVTRSKGNTVTNTIKNLRYSPSVLTLFRNSPETRQRGFSSVW